MKKIFIFVLFGFLMSNAFALTVMGNRSCGAWVDGRKTGGLTDIAANAWLVGYLSGLAVESNKDILGPTDATSLYLWVDKYCRDNPLDRLEKAGYILFIELEQKIKK